MNKSDDVFKKYSDQIYPSRRTIRRVFVIENLLKKLQGEIKEYGEVVQKLTTEKDARPDISHQEWANKQQEWSQNNLTNEKNQLQISLGQEQIKSQQLENDKTNLTAELTKLQVNNQQIIKEQSNYKTQLAQKENQLERTIKDFQEKEQNKHQEYLNILTKKEQDWETKLKEALKKPPTTEIGTQTDLTAEQITQMEKDLVQLKSQLPNPTENQLLHYLNEENWTDKYFIKQELETGQTTYQKWDWNQLRGLFIPLRTKLLELANSQAKGTNCPKKKRKIWLGKGQL